MASTEHDLSIARVFLDAFGGPDAPNTWQTFPDFKPPADVDPEQLGRIYHGGFDELAAALLGRNVERYGVSLTVGLTDGHGRRIENIERQRALFLDFDRGAPGSYEPLPPSIVVTTPRGAHAYWLLEQGDGTDLDRWRRVQKALCVKFRAEVCDDVTKALRCPGFLHQKGEPIRVELERCDPSRRFYSSDLVEAFDLQIIERRIAVARPIAGVPLERRIYRAQRYVDACRAVVQGQGETWDRTKAMCGIGGDFGLEPDEYWPILQSWNDRGDPPQKEEPLYRKLCRIHQLRNDPFGFRLDEDRDRTPEARLAKEGVRADVPWPDDEQRTGAARKVYREARGPDVGELDPSKGVLVGRRIVEREHEAPPASPWFEGLGAELPPLPTDADAPPDVLARDRGREQDQPGGDHGAPGGDHDVPPPEPPADAHGPETPPPAPPDERDDGGRRDGERRILDRDAPLETAKLFCAFKFRWRGRRILVHHQRSWYVWNGRSYRAVSREDLNARLYDYLAPAFHRTAEGDIVQFKPDETRVNKVRHALEAVSHLDDERRPPCWTRAAKPEDPQPAPHEIVACRNGLLHLPSGNWLGQRPDYFTLTSLGVNYNPDAARPENWLAFLEQLWPEDEPAQELLQEWFGLSLVPDTSFQKLLFVIGPRRSGKGTIARVLSELHGGEHNCAWLSMEDLVSRFGLHPLLDKSVAIMPDVRISHKLDQSSAVEKLLRITGEDSLQIDRKNLPVVHGQIGARFMLMSNLAPRLADAGAAFVSRMLALRMEASFLGKEDRQLKRKLVGDLRGERRVGGELEGILLWAIEGWRRLVERGHFVQPASSADVLEDMAELSTPVVGFVRACCETGNPEDFAHTDLLFEAWRTWCETEGRDAVGEKSTFVRNLRSAFPRLVVRRNRAPTGKRVKVLFGIKVLTDSELDAREQADPDEVGVPPPSDEDRH